MTSFLVTGGTGFLGSWCVKTLLDHGHLVRATVREPASPKCDFLRALQGAQERLELVKADLNDTVESWRVVVRGCKIVLHTASPVLVEGVPAGKEEEMVLKPAVNGTETVMKACIQEDVDRVVLTSSESAIIHGHPSKDNPAFKPPGFDESHWTNIDGLNLPLEMYHKSKTMAEKRAWELASVASIELAVINPGMIIGPFLSKASTSPSVTLLSTFLKKEYPFVPNLPLNFVDVRDVAKLHLNAGLSATASGKRFVAMSSSKSTSLQQMALELNAAGFDVPTIIWQIGF